MSDLTSPCNKAIVAIVGRPNVGKSTFFNRIIKSRKAITDPTPGVTRDPVFHDTKINDIEFTLVDTGGYKLDREGLDSLVSNKSVEILKEADIVLLMVEAVDITPEDEEFINLVRPYSKKTVLIINKVDSPQRESLAYNYFSFGFEENLLVSAEHAIGVDEFEELITKRLLALGYLPKTEEEITEPVDENDDGRKKPDGIIKISILGQPNTGKSTLSNLIIKKEASIVSDIAGTTRDIVENDFEYKNIKFKLLDTAGIRRKKNVYENIEYYSVNRAIKTIEECDVVFLMIDAVKGLSEQDKKIAGLVIDKGKGLVFVYNKLDLLDSTPNTLTAIEDRLRFLFPVLSFVPFIPISALKNVNIDKLLDRTISIYNQFYKRVETPSLNKALSEWVYENPIPSKGIKSYKVKYITQVWVAPQIFTVFVNRKKGFPDSWLSYLINRIRKSYGLHDIYIKLVVKDYQK